MFARSAATFGSHAQPRQSRSDASVRGVCGSTATYRRSGAAETISQFGSQVTFLALPLVAILVLNESTFRVALLTSVEFLPFLLFTLPAGVWVDRLRRRPILILGNVGRAVALLTVPIAHWFGVLTIWQLYGVGFVTGVCTVFFDVAYQSYLPALVGREQIVEGNSKLELSRAAASIGGPGLAGRLVSVLTAPVAILVGRGQLSRLGAPARQDSGEQGGAPAREERRPMRIRAPRRHPLRLHAPIPARHRAGGRALELLRQRRLLDPARLRGPRARPHRRDDRQRCSRSATSARWRQR